MIKSSITSIKHSELETVENIFSFLFKNLKQLYRVSYEFYFLFCKQKWHSWVSVQVKLWTAALYFMASVLNRTVQLTIKWSWEENMSYNSILYAYL